MKLYIFFSLAILLLVSSCKKENTGLNYENGSGKIGVVAGNNQSGVFGELLNGIIELKVSSANPENRFMITYGLLQGNGRVEQSGSAVPYLIRDTAGVIKVNWRMGCDANVQKIKFYIYTDSISPVNGYSAGFYKFPSDSVEVTANAVKPSGWVRACGYGNIYHTHISKIVTADHTTLYLVNNGLFSSTDGGLNWYKVKNIPYWEEIVDLRFNSNKWAYILTQNHGIYFSKDMVQWQAINNGILDYRSPTGFHVDDSTLFVSFYFDGPYRTTDNGGFWKKLIVGGYSQRFHHFTRHPNGNIMLFDDWGDLKISKNNGDNWSLVSLDYKYKPSSVYDFKVDPQGLLYIGAGDATISILDPVTYQGTFHRYYQWNASSQHINNITITPNDVYYLVNHTPTPGIYSKNYNWNLVNIGFNNPISYYFLKMNGDFLISSQGWLYFK